MVMGNRRKVNGMRVLCISGSPRSKGNTEYLLKVLVSEVGGEIIRLADCHFAHCTACWSCRDAGRCVFNDDMTTHIVPRLLASDAVVLGSPIFFNNVTADMKAFMDRTWCLRGALRNKIGAGIVVGRRYGAESAMSAIHSFFLKHDMIAANRGVTGLAFAKGEIALDAEAISATGHLARRIKELVALTCGNDGRLRESSRASGSWEGKRVGMHEIRRGARTGVR